MKSVLKWLEVDELLPSDFDWLEQANAAGGRYDRITPEELVQKLQAKIMFACRFVPGPGLLIMEVPVSNGIKRLALLKAVGHGVGWTFPQLAELLLQTAREWGCEGVETMVYSQRLAEAMLRVGCKTEAVKMFLPVENGNGQ